MGEAHPDRMRPLVELEKKSWGMLGTWGGWMGLPEMVAVINLLGFVKRDRETLLGLWPEKQLREKVNHCPASLLLQQRLPSERQELILVFWS